MMDEETGRWQCHALSLYHRGYKATVMHRQTFWLMLPLPICISVPHKLNWFYCMKVIPIVRSAEAYVLETAAISYQK